MKQKKKSITDEWWEEFEALEGIEPKIQAVKELCVLKADKEFYNKIEIGDAILKIGEASKDGADMARYHALLEILKNEYPDIFDMDAKWYVRDLIYSYIYTQKRERVKGMAEYLLQNPGEDPDIIGDLLDILIVNGFTDEAWQLLNFYYFFLRDGGNTIDEGIFELSVLAGFFIIYKNVNPEDGSFNLKAIKDELARFDCKPKENILLERLRIIASKEFHYTTSLKERKGSDGIYFLTCEFMRHLLDTKKTDFVCAHLLQGCMFNYLSETKQDICNFKKEEANEYIASWCGFISLRQAKAFIILCAMFLFYDFLYEKKLIGIEVYTKTKTELNELKDALFKAFEKSLRKYRFTEKLLGR